MIDKIPSRQHVTLTTTTEQRIFDSHKQQANSLKEKEQVVQQQKENHEEWTVWNSKENYKKSHQR